LLNAVDYILRNDDGFIYGEYSPYNDNNNISNEENEKITRSFYIKNGYSIITKKEFLENPGKYPELSEQDFEKTKERFDHSIIFKRNRKKSNYHFIEEGDTLIEQEVWMNKVNNFDSINILNKPVTK